MAATLPGSVGWPITGDKTIEFTRNPDDFVHSCVKTYSSKIFQTRMLNKPHVFVTSSQGVKELLEDKQEHFEMGYKDFGFMHSLFGDLILFCNYNEASRLHKILHALVKPEAMMRHLTDVDIVCSRNLDGLHNRENIVLYRLMKHLTTEISLTLFLGLDFEVAKSNASEIVDLTIAHWHGLISVPFNINVYGYKSGYGKAMKAKEHLLQVIEEQFSRSKNGFVKAMKEAEFHTQREAANHLLLFVSALVPKALASLLTSFCLELSKKANFERRRKAKEDDRYLDHVLHEVKRLWPPFLGGRRIAKKRVVLDGYQIPQGFSVGYFTKPANCDPKIFPEPERFYPERWDTWNKNDLSRVWTFGGGPRGCVGSAFIHRILKLVAKYLLQFYDWTVPEGQDLSYKWLPVSRPRNEVKIVFRAVSS